MSTAIHQKFYATALAELGTSEKAGPGAHNARILEYNKHTTLKATDDETPWCSSFACWVVESCGQTSPKSARARDWLKWGRELDTPEKGCICVLSRLENAGHVGFFDREEGHCIYVLGGNQGNSVSIAAYPKARLLEYRGAQ